VVLPGIIRLINMEIRFNQRQCLVCLNFYVRAKLHASVMHLRIRNTENSLGFIFHIFPRNSISFISEPSFVRRFMFSFLGNSYNYFPTYNLHRLPQMCNQEKCICKRKPNRKVGESKTGQRCVFVFLPQRKCSRRIQLNAGDIQLKNRDHSPVTMCKV